MEQSEYEASILRDEARRKNKTIWGVVFISCLLILVGAYFYYIFVWKVQQPIQADVVAIEAETFYKPPTPKVEAEVGDTRFVDYTDTLIPQPQLPTLDDSNDFAIEALGGLSTSDEWLKWMTTDEVLRKFVVVIDNIAAGKVAHKYISIPKPVEKFKVDEQGEKGYFRTDSYNRYNQYIELFSAISTDLLVTTYQQFLPLLEQAYTELAYPPEQTFELVFIRAIDVMLATPVLPEGEIELTQTSVVYKYANPELEGLSPVQKQILRMGPSNTAIVNTRLRALKEALRQ